MDVAVLIQNYLYTFAVPDCLTRNVDSTLKSKVMKINEQIYH